MTTTDSEKRDGDELESEEPVKVSAPVAVFAGSEQEIAADLMAVVESVCLKPVRLTKSGIPPKPLWNAINQRLVWEDPQTILYDWEEIDQVRFVYRLAESLDLFRPDADGWLGVGPGADQYFLASPLERARLLQRAYLFVFDWDERCDARDEEGHRHNFGRAHRRDFVHDPYDLRGASMALFDEMSTEWTTTMDLAKKLSEDVPDLLLSEVCELPDTDEDGVDEEKHRFLNYWFTLVARFGWTDIGRLGHASPTARLARLSDLGMALRDGKEVAEIDAPPLTIGPRLELQLAEGASVSDSYAVHRLTHAEGGEPRLTATGLRKAAADGADVRALLSHVRRRAIGELAAFDDLATPFIEASTPARFIHNVVLVEVDTKDRGAKKAAKRDGVARADDRLLAAGVGVVSLFADLDGEPDEGFSYPAEEPLASLEAGPKLTLHYEELPMQHRDLLLLLGAERDCDPIALDESALTRAREAGWTLKSFCGALAELTQRPVSAAVRASVANVLS